MKSLKEKDSEYKRTMAIRLILEGAKQLGWSVGIPGDIADDDEVPGLIMGNEQFMADYTEDENRDH